MPLIWIDRIRESSGCFEARVHAVIPGSKEPVGRRDRMIDTKGVNSIVNRVGDIDCVVIERPGLSGHRVVLEKVVPNIGDADCRDHVARKSGAATHATHSRLGGGIEDLTTVDRLPIAGVRTKNRACQNPREITSTHSRGRYGRGGGSACRLDKLLPGEEAEGSIVPVIQMRNREWSSHDDSVIILLIRRTAIEDRK